MGFVPFAHMSCEENAKLIINEMGFVQIAQTSGGTNANIMVNKMGLVLSHNISNS